MQDMLFCASQFGKPQLSTFVLMNPTIKWRKPKSQSSRTDSQSVDSLSSCHVWNGRPAFLCACRDGCSMDSIRHWEEKRGGTTESRGRIRFIGRVQCIQKECRTTRHISVQNLHRWREMEANADYEEREKSDEKGFVFSTTLETSSGRLFRVPITNDLCYKNIANLMKAI